MSKALRINREVANQDYFLNSFSFNIDSSHLSDFNNVGTLYDWLNDAFYSFNKNQGRDVFCFYYLDEENSVIRVVVNSTCVLSNENEYGFDFRMTLFNEDKCFDYVFHVRESGGHLTINADVTHREYFV